MSRTSVVALTTVTLLGVPCVAVAATPPEHLTMPIAESSVDGFLSEACGTEVTLTFSGVGDITLWRNEEGLVVRELDRYVNGWATWTTADGGSFSKRYDVVSEWDYGSGAVVGGPVTITAHGAFFHVPGSTSAIAGRETAEGTVDRIDENGVPIVDFAESTGFVGHQPDFDFAEVMCEALGS